MHKDKLGFVFAREGDIVHCKGDNFEYYKLGAISKFTQTGKIPSLRVIKVTIKKLQEV